MSKKKINNRLDKLFDDIQPEEAPARPGKATKKPAQTARLNPASVPAQLIKPTVSAPRIEHAAGPPVERSESPASVLSLAFQMRENDWATLRILDEANHREWGEDEHLLVRQVADQLSLALENARLFQEEQSRAAQLQSVSEISSAVSTILNPQELLEKFIELTRQRFNLYHAHIFVLEDDRHTLDVKACGWKDAEKAGTHETRTIDVEQPVAIVARAARTLKPVILNNVRQDAAWLPNPNLPDVQSEMAVPVMAQEKLIGVLNIHADRLNAFDENDAAIMTTLAAQIGAAIQNARLYDSAEYRAAAENLVSQISSSFINVPAEQVDEQINAALQKLGEFSHTDRAYLFQFTPDGAFMNNTHEWVRAGASSLLETRKNYSLEAYSQFLKTLEEQGVFHVPRVAGLSDEASAERRQLLREDVKSILCVPLGSRGKIEGFIGFDTVNAEKAWPEQDINMLRLVGEIFTGALQRQRAELENIRLLEATRQSQAAAARSEAELRALFSAMTDVIIVLDRKGTYLRIAPTNPSRLFRPAEEMIGRTVREVLPQYIHEPMMSAIDEALNSGRPVQLEYWLEIEGRTYWFDGSFSKLSEEQVFLVARDITERKRAEELIRQRNEYLAASSDIGRTITSTLDLDTIFAQTVELVAKKFDLYFAGIYTVEETGFNAIFRNGTGKAGEDLRNRKYRVPITPNTVVGRAVSLGRAVILNDTISESIFKPHPFLPESRSEVGIPLRVGTRVTGVLDLQANRPAAFHPDEVAVLQTLADQVAIAIDNARSYELSQQAVREMREIDRLKSQFLANMSHELRTPLNSIIGFSRVILKGIDGPITELQQQDLTAIYNSGQHLLALINDILDLAKIEAGKMELAFDEVNMGDVINSVLSTVTGLIKDKSITLKKNIEPNLPAVRADAIRIRQVLINLFSNAAKFTDEGSITVDASLQTGRNGRQEILISVTDTGPGIAPEDQAKLFQAFSQVDDSPTRKTGGTGLGLSISQNLVQLHGGSIGLKSEVGKGSTFYFTLPVYRGAQEETPAPQDGKVILAVDDDPQVIGLYERYLQPQGYHVIAVTDPARAKERAAQLKPYAVTLDIMMPGYDGWQVLNDLKSDPATRDVPVIICSIIEDQEKGFSLGAADYLVKPILEEDLLGALDRLNADNSIKEVLVVDDDPNDLRLIGKMLNDQGRYKPLLVEGGAKGLEAIVKSPPQAVILDLFMPDVDGFTILEKMRSDRRLRDIPVVIVSGGGLTEEQQKQLSDFGQRLIAKGSLNETDLLATIERALKRVNKVSGEN